MHSNRVRAHKHTPGAYGAHGLHKRLQELEAEGRNPFAPPKAKAKALQAAASALARASESVLAWVDAAPSKTTTTTPPRSPTTAITQAPSPTAHDVWSRAGVF